jgi:hypothetical protein
MATKKVIEMTARSTSTLSYDDYLYLTGEAPDIDEKMQASVLRDYVLSGIKTSANSGLAQTSTSYAGANPEYELTLDANNLDIAGGTIGLTDYLVIEAVGSGLTKKMTAANVLAATTSAVTSVNGGDGITVSPTTGATAVEVDLKANGGLVIETAKLAIDLAASSITGTLADGDIASAATWNAKQNAITDGAGLDFTGDTLAVETTTNGGLEFSGAGDAGTLQVAQGISQYDVAQFAASVVDDDFLRIDGTTVEGRSASEVLTDIAASPVAGSSSIVTVGTLSGGTIEGTSVLSTTETGTAKFLRVDGDNSSSWQVPPDTNTTYSAGDGLDLSTTTFSVDLTDTTTFTSANTVSKAVVRDGSGDFAAGTITADLTGDVTGESILLDGNKNITPGDGSMIHVDTATLTDNVTAISGTATKFTSNSFEGQTLAATNASVTTTDAATVYISGPTIQGTNETLTRTHALWVDSGNARFDGSIYSGTTEAINSSGLVTVANQSNITGVSTITSGTWNGTEVGLGYGGTELVGETDGKIVIADGAGAPVHLDVGSSTGITILGTVATGVWNGTAIDGTYIDIEGTEVKSTGETGGTKFLREDGDNSCSWQPVPAAGISAGFSIAMAVAL